MITIYSKLQKFPWFPGYKVEVKYKLFSLKKFILSFFMITIYSKFPWLGYKVEVKHKLFSLKKFILSFFMITIYSKL